MNPLRPLLDSETELRGDPDNIPLWNRLTYRTREKMRRIMFFCLLAVGMAIIAFPIYWMVRSSLETRGALTVRPLTYIPWQLSIDNYQSIFIRRMFPRWYLNTIIVSTGVVALTTTCATLAGYGLTRIDIPMKKAFARGILFGYMFPSILLAIPMFILWREIGMLNSIPGVIFGITAISLPFSIWLMWKFFQTVPYSLEESAQMNGAPPFQAFYDIALPLAKPGMIAVAVYSYAVAWDQYTIPLIIMSEPSRWVLVQGLDSFTELHTIQWGELMAASVLTILPAFFFVYFLQKYLLRGFRAGGIG